MFFDTLSQLRILFKYQNPRAIGTIPDGHAMIAADQVYKMLEWIETEFQEEHVPKR